ncbi:MAG TPA: DUF2892 domain-containing protein [Opitutus sp.]|nr:DUF2892 domain-containing protein [Opitutus sp.]
MKRNVGSYDAAVRFIAGCGLIVTVNHGYGWWGLIGLAPILSAATGFCPVYWLFHLDTTGCDKVNHHG